MRAFLLLLSFLVILPGFAAESDALAIDANIQAKHYPYDGIIDPIYAAADSDVIVGYTRCGDSALWTGSYLAAESFRYKVTQSADALSNMQKAIAGIEALVDVTGNNLLARCIIPLNSQYATGIQSEEGANGIYINSPWFWVGNTSRDEYAGVVFGLAIAYDMVDDPTIKSSISDLITRVIEYPRGHNWKMPEPDGSTNLDFIVRPDYINTFLEIGRHINPARFNGNTIEEDLLLAVPISAPIQVDTGDDNSYFKFNLDYLNFYNLVRLDPNQGNTDSRNAYNILRAHTAGHLNAFFDIVDRALNGPNAARDAETLLLLDQWLTRPRRDAFVDLSNTVAVCGMQACQPVPVALRPPTDFLWQRSPFQLSGGLSGTIETAGIDYILPYWMTRYYGVVQSFMVQSAAAPVQVVAPKSLASAVGTNLASQTAQADPQTLPTTLGGISIAITDAAGNQSMAGLTSVAPGQIQFVVPKGVATGTATFTITNGTASMSAPVNVQNVAPTLSSADGTGSGVADATAERVQVANPNLRGPVQVFQCDASGCTATPIPLGVDTPIHVSLHGTGIRNRSALANVSLTIGSISVPVLYAGPWKNHPGMDEVKFVIPITLRGSGVVPVMVTVDGQTSNAVTLNIQ